MSEGEIIDVLPIRSEESVFIQLADLLSGVVSFHFNNNDVKIIRNMNLKRLENILVRVLNLVLQ